MAKKEVLNRFTGNNVKLEGQDVQACIAKGIPLVDPSSEDVRIPDALTGDGATIVTGKPVKYYLLCHLAFQL